MVSVRLVYLRYRSLKTLFDFRLESKYNQNSSLQTEETIKFNDAATDSHKIDDEMAN